MTISCEQCREWLSDLLDAEDEATSQPDSQSLLSAAQRNGASAAPERVLLMAHLATCADCSCDLNMLRNLRSALRALPHLDAPSDLRARVRAQITETPASAPLLVPPAIGAETLNQSALTNGHYRPMPQPTATPPSFITSLARFFSRPANVAWASGAALAAFCLVLFTQEQPHIVLPPTNVAATPSMPVVVAPHVSKAGKPNGVATVPHSASVSAKKSAGAATTKPQSKHPTSTDPSPMPEAPDAALTVPPVIPSDEGGRTEAKPTTATHTRDAVKHPAITPMADHINNQTPHAKIAAPGIAPTPKGANSSQAKNATPPATAPTPVAGASGSVSIQAPVATPPFARLTLFARAPGHDVSIQANSTPPLNPVEPGPTGPGGIEAGPANPPTDSTATPGAPALPSTDVNPSATVAPFTNHSRIATNPGHGTKFGAPLRPGKLITHKAQPSIPFGLVGAERAAHLVVVPPRDIKAARLDITLSSGLRYADQTGGTWRTVWKGAAQAGHPIAVDLPLVATASGTQNLQVKLLEVSPGDTEDAKIAQSETLNLDVKTP